MVAKWAKALPQIQEVPHRKSQVRIPLEAYLWEQMLCILTGQRVLRMPFAGQYQFFDTKTTFLVTKGKKRKESRTKTCKNMQ